MAEPTKKPAATPSAIIIGPMPPPIHGAALVTALIAEKMKERGAVRVCDISPGRFERGPRYHLTRVRKVWAAAWKMANAGFRAGGAVYLSAAGGSGLLYNVLIAAVARLLGFRVALHHHAFSYLDRWDWKMALLLRLCGRAALNICLSPHMAALLLRRYGAKARVLSNAAFFLPKPLVAGNGPRGPCAWVI